MTKKSNVSSQSIASLLMEWNDRLNNEGMPEEPKPITDVEIGHHGHILSVDKPAYPVPYNMSTCAATMVLDNVTENIFDSPRAEYWRKVSHAANALPANFKDRAFLVLYAEIGEANAAARECGLNRTQMRSALKRFAKYCAVVKDGWGN